jgi:hypothetical protein
MSGAGNSMFPDPPEPPQLVQTAAQGPWGGSSYSYRGARTMRSVEFGLLSAAAASLLT